MRSIEDIRDTGAAWVTEAELAMLCAFAKRAEAAEAKLAELQTSLRALRLSELDALKAEVVRLRTKLRVVAGMNCQRHGECGKDEYNSFCAPCAVRRALAPAQPEEGKRWPCGHERSHPEDELCRECSP